MPTTALATSPSVTLHAAFRPEVPGQGTTVYFRLRIKPARGELVPPPLVELNVKYPAGLSLALSGLGIDACTLATLEMLGPQGCPPNSVMGGGGAIAEFPLHREVFNETAEIAILRAGEEAGRQALFICVRGETAVAQLVMSTQLLPAHGRYGGVLHVHVPLVESLAEAPDLAVAEIKLVLGPQHLHYTEIVHNKKVRYTPKGIPLPRHCPSGGYPFAVALRFQEGTRAGAHTAVPCPARSKRRPGKR